MTPRTLLEFFADARGLDNGLQAKTHQRRDRPMRPAPGDRQADRQAEQGLSPARRHGSSVAARADVLILDEPTAGLDPNQIREVREAIRRLSETKTILLSTHILQEVKGACQPRDLYQRRARCLDGTPEALTQDGSSMDEHFHRLTVKRNASLGGRGSCQAKIAT